MGKLTTQDYTERRMLVNLLDVATPSLREIARDAGITYHAIRRYREGQRTPSPKVLRALLAAVRKRSEQLAKLADELEAAAREPTPYKRSPKAR